MLSPILQPNATGDLSMIQDISNSNDRGERRAAAPYDWYNATECSGLILITFALAFLVSLC